MKLAVPREIAPGERRVALTPDAAAALVKSGLAVLVERGAGEGAFHADAAFEKAGARIVPDAAALYAEADVVLKVQKPALAEVDQLREGTVLVAFLQAGEIRLLEAAPPPAQEKIARALKLQGPTLRDGLLSDLRSAYSQPTTS